MSTNKNFTYKDLLAEKNSYQKYSVPISNKSLNNSNSYGNINSVNTSSNYFSMSTGSYGCAIKKKNQKDLHKIEFSPLKKEENEFCNEKKLNGIMANKQFKCSIPYNYELSEIHNLEKINEADKIINSNSNKENNNFNSILSASYINNSQTLTKHSTENKLNTNYERCKTLKIFN